MLNNNTLASQYLIELKLLHLKISASKNLTNQK